MVWINVFLESNIEQKKFKGPKRTLACSGALNAERILNVDLKDFPYLKKLTMAL